MRSPPETGAYGLLSLVMPLPDPVSFRKTFTVPVASWRYLLAGLLITLLSQSHAAIAQTPARVTISGTLKDARTGEDLSGATVRLVELPSVGTTANAYGFFTLTVAPGDYTLEASFIGYQPLRQAVALRQNTRLDLRLTTGEQGLAEVVVTAKATDAPAARAQLGVESIDLKQIAKVPVLFGEKDVLKTLQLLPGIKSAGEGSSGFSVRGGGLDQNLILLDEAPVYNASHLLGFFSTFNSDALKDMTVYKGGMPAQYGGRLSSVVDLKMKDGNNQQLHGSGGIGLIASRLALEGPLGKQEKGSFLVTGRRTYADVFLAASSDETINQSTLYFYDLNAKANYKLSDHNRVYLSAYLGRDVLGLSESFSNSYGNQTATLRWNHLFTDKLFSNTSLIYSKYSYQIVIGASDDAQINIDSKIRDFNLKEDLEYYPTADQTIRFGGQVIHHTITPGKITSTGATNSVVNNTEDQTNRSLESAAYVSHDWQATPRLAFTTGLRLSAFTLLGPNTLSTYDADGDAVTTTDYASGEAINTYFRLEPRFATSFQLTESTTLKAGYARNVQNLHLMSNTTSSSPTDLYIPTSLNVKPELADQISTGYYRTFGAKTWAFSAEVYYKWLQNQIDYRDGTELRGNLDVESTLLYGKGRAYGMELLLKKETGRLTGWVGYTLSKTERQFVGINDGAWFNARFDRPHDVSVVAIYQLTPKWSLSGTWVASTGNAVTYPVGKYAVGADRVVTYYGLRNAERMPSYQRLDLGATFEPTQKHRRWKSSWSFSVYNALARENPYSIRFETDPNDASRTRAVQTSLFKLVPSATYNFSF